VVTVVTYYINIREDHQRYLDIWNRSVHVVVSCGRKMFDVSASETVVHYLKMFGVCDVAEAVATRKDRFVKRYALSSSVVCAIYSICS